MNAKGSLFVITASSGTGKTSLVKSLLKNINNLAVSISHTTREPRSGELDGTHYHFTTVEEFKKGIKMEDFFEYAEVFGNYYGTSKSSIKSLLDEGIDVILEIDWQGALQVKKMYESGDISDLTMIFILPPTKEALRDRLSGRGQDSAEVIERRLAGAVTEMKQYNHFDYVVINDDFEQALAELSAIIIAKRQLLSIQKIRHKQMILDLIDG